MTPAPRGGKLSELDELDPQGTEDLRDLIRWTRVDIWQYNALETLDNNARKHQIAGAVYLDQM